MSTTIRQASLDDVALIVDLTRRSFRDVADRFRLTDETCPHHPSHCTTESVSSALANGVRYFILETDGGPAGCVALERADGELCYLKRLGVLPAHRRRGFGAALVNHVLAQARQGGTPRVEIGIIAELTELQSWYEKFGFVMKETKRFPHLPFTVAILYRVVGG